MKFVPVALFLLAFLAGCAGMIDEGMPTLTRKLPRSRKVYLAIPENRSGRQLHARGSDQVLAAFAKALDKRHVRHSSFTNGCDTAFTVTITGWEYNDEGFTGKGARDAVHMEVRVWDLQTRRVRTRATLYARKLDELIDDYVEKVFVNPEDAAE